MSKRPIWRGLHELVDAKECAREVLAEIERLLKRHRALSGEEIRAHSDRLVVEIDEVAELAMDRLSQIVADLDAHKKKLLAKAAFLRRHYRIK